MIRIENIYKSFGDVHAVKDITFNVGRGEVVGLLGPNGAGKTTTMRMVAGYMAPDSGSIFVNEIPVISDNLETKLLIGYLPEDSPVYSDMEVVDFLEYIGRIRGLHSNTLHDRIDEMVETCGLRGVAGRTAGKLSRGYRQRLGLAQAMIHHPPILILDEPTSGLDPNQIAEIRSLIRKIGEKRTVILSTHIMQEVEATCSRAFIINHGELVAKGTLDELMLEKKGRTGYLVSLKARRDFIEEAITELKGFRLIDYMSRPDDEWQLISLHKESPDVSGAQIFEWAVSKKVALRELREERASLEEVFRSLTIGESL